MSRVKSEFWVKAYLKRLSLEGISGYVIHHGDDDAGDIVIKLVNLNCFAQLFQREYKNETEERNWVCVFSGSEQDADISIKKKLGFDTDLWVIEVDDIKGQHSLDHQV